MIKIGLISHIAADSRPGQVLTISVEIVVWDPQLGLGRILFGVFTVVACGPWPNTLEASGFG
jgi:hypothetical protein